MVQHQAFNDPVTGRPATESRPLGDWSPCTMGEIYGLMCDVPILVLWEPGFYGSFLGDKPLERCTGSWPNTYHVRLCIAGGCDAKHHTDVR